MNGIKTGILLAGLTALFMGAGFMLGGEVGMVIALIFACATNLFAYWNADKIVLRMYNAKEVTAQSAPGFYGIVEQLARRAQMPMPKVYIIDSDQPNAFATGRNPENAAVAATRGLLRILDNEEIAGVMAHELAHVKNRDTLIMTVTATIAGALSMLANFALFFGGNRNNPLGIIGTIAMMILAPVAAMLVQMAISRTREYGADAGGAATRCGSHAPLKSWNRDRVRSTMTPPRRTRQRHTCSSSIRYMCTASTVCFQRTLKPQTVSKNSARLPASSANRGDKPHSEMQLCRQQTQHPLGRFIGINSCGIDAQLRCQRRLVG